MRGQIYLNKETHRYETKRADGVMVEICRTEEIDIRKQNAEIASKLDNGGVLGWPKFYDKDTDREQMAADFIWMRAEIDRLRAVLAEREYALEAAGVEVSS